MTAAEGTADEGTTQSLGDLEGFWRMQHQWSRLADVKKRRVVRGRVLALVLIVVAAALGALSATLASPAPSPWSMLSKACAAGAAGCAALLPLLRPLYTGKALVEFTVARRISENIKSLLISWLAMNGGLSGKAGTRELTRQVMGLRLMAPELIAELDVTGAPQSSLPPISDGNSYLAWRVREQIDSYYRPRARRIDRTLEILDRCSFGLGLVGAFLGATTVTIGGTLAGWIAVVTTVATALSAHIAASQYRFQQLEFTRTAEQLEQLLVAATDTPPLGLAEIVRDGEAIILGENRAWQTALSKSENDEHGSA